MRHVLRQFFKRLRFGCLQRRVWVTPHDMRREYGDFTIRSQQAGYRGPAVSRLHRLRIKAAGTVLSAGIP